MHLADLLAQPDVTIDAIAEWCDSVDHPTRLAATRELGRAQQRKLYELAADAPALSVNDFVDEAVPALQPVRHHGTNTLPLPKGLRMFEKRFCKPDTDADARRFGYNEGATRPLIGPGYFVAIPTDGNPAWEQRGSVVVDYFQVPDGAVAEGWPAVKPNSSGLQVLVYNKTRDFMRRVSEHVTIGAAYKVEKPLDHYFTLVREG